MARWPSPLADELLHQQIICNRYCEDKVVKDDQHSGNNNLHAAVLLNDVDWCVREVKQINVNDANVKGEIPLHIAAKNKSPQGLRMLQILIAAGSDVNARNKWHQTPLHYAAIVISVENIATLIKVPTIDVNVKDVNGYNPLQAMLCIANDDIPGDFDSPVSSGLQKAICILLQAGTKINDQTKYGRSILHLAAVRKDNTPLLRLLITKKNVNLSLKDTMGENFLHVYATAEVPELILEMFSNIAEQSLTTIRHLLTQQNVMGRTPWEIMIDEGNSSSEAVEQVIKYGVTFERSDNLGNTVIHRNAGVILGMNFCDILHALIKGGARVNSKNVFGESPASVLLSESLLKVFLKYEFNCNTLDRWGRSPLISIMQNRPDLNMTPLLRELIEQGHADVNSWDRFGSTPLHFAAYNNNPEQVKMLLAYGADMDATDNLNDRPFDTMRRHCSYRCKDILKRREVKHVTVLYRRNSTLEDTLFDLPETITSSSIQTPDDVQRLLGLPENLDQFTEDLMEMYFNRSPEQSYEIKRVEDEINSLVKSLCKQIVQYDSRFEMSAFPTGSSAEGTKVGRPDEFDFVLCLDKLNAITDIVMTKECQETGFVCLKFKDNPVSEEYLPFSDMDGYFLALPFLQYFLQYIRRALNETHLWKSGQLYNTSKDNMAVVQGKPVFNFSVVWVGSVYKQLNISIDLVPAVYKKGWWPPNINVANISLMTDAIQAEGCFLILQTKSNDFDYKRHSQSHIMKDSISQTCNNDRNERTLKKQRMLRVSAAPAEICLVKSMPTNFRQAYILAKIVKSKEVCPEIKIDKLPTSQLGIQQKYKPSTPPLQPSNLIKSYMLKNCAFFILHKLQFSLREEYRSLEAIKITSKMYEYLLEFADKQKLSPYFLPYSDVFDFESLSEDNSDFKTFMLRLKRELSIKLVLGILNHPFPIECLASRI